MFDGLFYLLVEAFSSRTELRLDIFLYLFYPFRSKRTPFIIYMQFLILSSFSSNLGSRIVTLSFLLYDEGSG